MRRPLATVGLCVFATNLIALFVPSAACGLLAVLLVIGCAVMYQLMPHRRIHTAVVAASVLAAILLRGLFWHMAVLPARDLADEQVHQVEGRAVSVQRLEQADQSVVTARITKVDGRRISPALRVRFFCRTSWETGMRFQTQMLLAPPVHDRFLASAYADKIYVSAALKDEEQTLVISNENTSTVLDKLRKSMRTTMKSLLPGTLGDVACAMTLGMREQVSAKVQETIRIAGLSHILVVSGLHLSVVSGACYWLARRWLRRRGSAAWAAAATVLYMSVVGFAPSVVRAGVMLLAIYAAQMLSVRADAWTSLGAVMLAMCLENPLCVGDAGLLLSCAATAGVLLASAWAALLRKRLPSFAGSIVSTMLHSLLAAAAGIPVLALFNMGISVYSLPANLLAMPVGALTLISGLCAQVLGMMPVLRLFAPLAGIVCGLGVRWILFCAQLIAALPGHTVYLSGVFSAVLILALYGLIAWAVFHKISFGKAVTSVALFCTVNMLTWYVLTDRVITVTAVGAAQNASILVQQGERSMLLLRGGKSSWSELAQELARRGEASVDMLVDLRTNPQKHPVHDIIAARQTVIVEQELIQHRTFENVLPNADLVLVRQADGIAAILDCEGVLLATDTGKTDWSGLPKPHLYVSSSTVPQNFSCDVLLSTRKPTEEMVNSAQAVHRGKDSLVKIRAGASYQIQKEYYGLE